MEALIQLFNRDIDKLKLEIESFKNEENLWQLEGQISNTAGNLCLHLIGNLNHFIGAVMGNSGYVRDREAEFNNKNIDRDQLIKMILDTKTIVASSLKDFEQEKIHDIYPIQVFGEDMTYEFFLIHLVSHLNYHLGQINYLRRILDI
ncbi:MAG: DUF1572 family protein [Cyclobacteriaceae bacterium]|nr:DUF1572 family protein [Cyclobacteriaceae bacterium]